LLSKNAIAGSAFSTLMLLKGILLTVYPQIVMRMIRPLPTTNVTSTISQYDLLCNTLIIIGVIGILSGLLITILDYYNGGKTLWNEDELRVRMPRFSFAVIGQSDR
jgi:hypothetical protein